MGDRWREWVTGVRLFFHQSLLTEAAVNQMHASITHRTNKYVSIRMKEVMDVVHFHHHT
jgi:hypothetical protein